MLTGRETGGQTLSEEKQIEEMAKIIGIPCYKRIEEYGDGSQECPSPLPCNECTAELLYNAGYRKQSGWISVDERLPSSEDLERSQFHNFLVANEFGEVREAVFTGKYFAKLGSRLSGVTHWMPLPEPPVTKGA